MNRLLYLALIPILAWGCQSKEPADTDIFFEQVWPEQFETTALYRLAPGDQLEIIVHTAPELSRTVTIEPDGRIRMPYSGPVTAASRSVEQVRTSLRAALSSELRNPDIDVLLVKTVPQNIFIGGDVENPGLFELPGLINPLQAIIMAGGVSHRGRSHTVILMRRTETGDVNSAIFNPGSGFYDPTVANWASLRAFDVIYVSRKPISEPNLFARDLVRDALPVDFFLFYGISEDDR